MISARRAAGTAARLKTGLGRAANPDGGLPYHTRRASRLEPTAWAALASDDPEPARRYLAAAQRADGLLADAMTAAPNLAFNALGLLALCAAGPSAAASRIRGALVQRRGLRLPQVPALRQNNALQAWGWVENTFSWVEPTALAAIALRKEAGAGRALAPDAVARVDEAEALLIDRACAGGGWNYGNPHVYGTDLQPYVPTTALALIALQHQRTHAVVARSLAWLRTSSLAERSGMALSLASIALRIFDEDTGAVDAALVEVCDSHDASDSHDVSGNLHAAAMAAYALSAPRHDVADFRC